MNRSPQIACIHKQRGFSLVELMIALALGLVLIAGVWQVFTSSTQAYRLTDSLSQVQENVRFAMGRLQYEGRMAGYQGCLIGEPFNNLNSGSAGWVGFVYNNQPVIGWEADGTTIGDAYTNTDFDNSNTSLSNATDALHPDLDSVLPGSDVVVINNARPANVTLNNNPSGDANTLVTADDPAIPDGEILMVVNSSCTGADIFQKTNAINSNSLTKGSGNVPGNQTPVNGGFSQTYDDNATVYQYSSTAFFIGMGSNGQPALFVRRLDSSGSAAGDIELVEGVENMQVLYGLNAAGTGAFATSYVDANGVANWNNVVSIRIALLIQSDDGVEVDLSDGPYNLLGTEVTTVNDQRARLVGVVTIGIRNRLE